MAIIQEINDFLTDNMEALIDHVQTDCKCYVDPELSKVYDMVTEKFYNVCFEEIVKVTVERIKTAIETFEEK